MPPKDGQGLDFSNGFGWHGSLSSGWRSRTKKAVSASFPIFFGARNYFDFRGIGRNNRTELRRLTKVMHARSKGIDLCRKKSDQSFDRIDQKSRLKFFPNRFGFQNIWQLLCYFSSHSQNRLSLSLSLSLSRSLSLFLSLSLSLSLSLNLSLSFFLIFSRALNWKFAKPIKLKSSHLKGCENDGEVWQRSSRSRSLTIFNTAGSE